MSALEARGAARPAARRYLRPPVPLRFPVEAHVPETRRHFELRTALYFVIQREFGDRVVTGSDQFVYWDPTDARQCLAPDVMVWVGGPDQAFDSWKVWERGAPHLAVEIVSSSDASEAEWEQKLERYRRAGVFELARFDPESRERPLRLWDRVEEDLVERDLSDPAALACDALGLYWCVTHDARLGPMLRLAQDAAGTELLLTDAEARERAEARNRELEAELAKLRG